MKTIAAGLKEAIADNGTVATCIRIARKDGVVIGFTNHDVKLTVGGVDYLPLPALERIVMKLRNNAEVSNQDFVAAFVVDLEEEDIANGLYNEASFDILYVDWANPANGSLTVFAGVMGNIQWSREGFRCDIFNLMYKLDGVIGTIVTPKCRHQLFSQIGDDPWQVGSCKLSAASHTYTGTVNTVTTQKLSFTETGVTAGADVLSNGVLTWTSGLNNGAKYEVKGNTTSAIDLFLPTVYSIQAGDTFSVTAGCDKTLETCRDTFNNVINFGGFPFKGDQ